MLVFLQTFKLPKFWWLRLCQPKMVFGQCWHVVEASYLPLSKGHEIHRNTFCMCMLYVYVIVHVMPVEWFFVGRCCAATKWSKVNCHTRGVMQTVADTSQLARLNQERSILYVLPHDERLCLQDFGVHETQRALHIIPHAVRRIHNHRCFVSSVADIIRATTKWYVTGWTF